MSSVMTYCTALLGISPSDNNGTFGALHHFLKDDVVKKLPEG